LLVEDNPINQELSEALLQRSGARVTTVENGAAAVRAMGRDSFDLILMDIQMPEMDGIEATRRIRQLPRGGTIPIIAMTANALPGDRERYLDAGMDDYIAKPVDPNLLHQVLRHWCGLIAPVQQPASSASTFETLQQAGIDTERALHQLMQNHELYRRLLLRFVEERAQLPEQLQDAWARGDTDTMLTHVHSLKSLAGSLGLQDLEQASLQLEQQLRAGQADACGLEQVCVLIRDAITLVRAWLYQSEPPF